MAKIGRGSNKIQSTAGFEVDISQINTALDQMDQIPSQLPEIATRIKNAGHSILQEEFEYAMEAQSLSAFPEEFRNHIREVVSSAYFDVQVTSTSIAITFDFNQLGTVQELKQAFHQGARTADGDVVDGPYNGEELNEEDASKRHLFWEAMARGEAKAPHPNDPTKSIRIEADAWQKTKEKYISIWGDKAPQWLYLQFGQRKWQPSITPGSIIEGFTAKFNEIGNEIFNNELARKVETSQTPYGIRLTAGSTELGPSGQPRRAGQFYPRR